jgi:3alpha(or 20beta)-hydroxysteroid dehydrogenase
VGHVVTGDLAGRVAVVTGGSRGIGAAVVEALAGAGAAVVVAGGSAEHGRALAAGLGDAVRYQPHDVASERSWDELVVRVREALGEIDLLVNNAGVLDPGPDISETSVENFERHYRVNQLGVFLGMRAVAGPMKRARHGYGHQIGYSTTKWAVRGMTQCAAVELGPHGVRVNAVAPGFVDTTMIDVMPGEQIRAVTAATPLGRRGTPAEIARAVLFLAAEDCPFVTGAELVVDGGLAL